MKDKIYVLAFTLVITAVFTGVVSLMNAAVKDKIELNKKVAKQSVILGLLGKNLENASDSEIEQIYKSEVVENKEPEIYSLKNPSGSDIKIIMVSGQGFWGPIFGYMAIDIQKKVIAGVEFTNHNETPGLGGRISEDWFKQQFIGLSVDHKESNGKRIKMVAKVADSGDGIKREFDAITGATETSKSIQNLVNNSLDKYAEIWSGKK